VSAEITVVGRIRVAGSTPLESVLLAPDDSGRAALEVVGDYRAELQRLSGARVKVVGALSGAGRLLASRYAILEVAGHVPVVGRLSLSDGKVKVVTAEGEAVPVRDAPAELRAQAGAKVWVILDERGAVTGYGILRER
jgi:hypothetical protein